MPRDISLAAIILAHADPTHLHRLISALEETPIFLHVDLKTDADTFAEMTDGLPERVHLVPRVPMWICAWSLVEAELRGLRAALATTDAGHIAVLSGSDYPLCSMDSLREHLSHFPDRSLWNNFPLPYAGWETSRFGRGGLWRLDHRFFFPHGRMLTLGRHPVFLPWRRRLPGGVVPSAGSQFKIYARPDAERLIHIVDTRPDLVAFWKTTLIPDETFASSMLASTELVGADHVLQSMSTRAWFTLWDPEHPTHPLWLCEEHFPELTEAARERGDVDRHDRTLFARKFSTARDSAVLDLIDREMRSI